MKDKMPYKTVYDLHHHFPKIAEESGFTFKIHRPGPGGHVDWKSIKLLDIESLIKDRKFVLIEQHLNDIIECVLESEFDVRILDEGFLKMFRLAQLAVEYQQFCRSYLDHSINILRKDINSVYQELETTKKNLEEREDELKKVKRRIRHTYKTPLPYGNENIANMILKTLSNRAHIFSPTSHYDNNHQYNKCRYCDKVFMNQLYLKSHIERRHADFMELPQKERDVEGNQKLTDEISELKTKLKEMEQIVASTNKPVASTSAINVESNDNIDNLKYNDQNESKNNSKKILKDAEVSTNNDEYYFNKLIEWKKEEQEKHTREINQLRNEILESIQIFKPKEDQLEKKGGDTFILEKLNDTIKQQEAEIIGLKEALRKIKAENDFSEKNKEVETRVAFWIQKVEAQNQQYESLLEKLNLVAKDAKESRAMADAERERAVKLEALLEKRFNSVPNNTDELIKTNMDEPKKIDTTVKHESLQNLQKRAQELLNIDSISSSTSASNSVNFGNILSRKQILNSQRKKNKKITVKKDFVQAENLNQIKSRSENDITKFVKKAHNSEKQSQLHLRTAKDVKPTIETMDSPMKVVRAKLTEEVNNQLVMAGVDPLRSRLSQNVFRKQRAHLQQQHELKSKKNAEFDKVRNSILTYLDKCISNIKIESNHGNEYKTVSTKPSRHFRSLASVIGNVKTKARSLVKGNNMNITTKSLSAEVSNKALSLLKTPPGSDSTSPQHTSPMKAKQIKEVTKQVTPNGYGKMKLEKVSTKSKGEINLVSDDSEISNVADHNYYNTPVVQISSKSMENLLKSPARRPASADLVSNNTNKRYTLNDNNKNQFIRSQSITQLNVATSNNATPPTQDSVSNIKHVEPEQVAFTKGVNFENIEKAKQTKGVLKNSASLSSLNKKKVLFDMDAIQMKSMSASPSQSITEKSDNDNKYELGLTNLDTEEWDISSIESENLKNDTKIRFPARTTPKIAELKKTIEDQLARRSETQSSALVGSVDLLGKSLVHVTSIGGSNTSLGSSILDESGSPLPNHSFNIKTKKANVKNDSDFDISDPNIKNESF